MRCCICIWTIQWWRAHGMHHLHPSTMRLLLQMNAHQ
jgi:hypothetical protein